MEKVRCGSGIMAVAMMALVGCGDGTTSSAGMAASVAAVVAGGIAGVKLNSSHGDSGSSYRRSAMRPVDHEAVALAGGADGYWLGVCSRIDRAAGRPDLGAQALPDGTCLLHDGSLDYTVTHLARLLVHEAQHVRDGGYSVWAKEDAEQRANCADALFSASIGLGSADRRVARLCDRWPDVVATHRE